MSRASSQIFTLSTITSHNDMVPLEPVFYTIGRRQGEDAAEETLDEVPQLSLTIIAPDANTVLQAARMKMHHTLSYADAFAAVTAQGLQATLMTGDPELLALTDLIALEALHRHPR